MAKATDHYAQRDFHIGEEWFLKNADLSHLPNDQLRGFQVAGLAGPKIVGADASATASADTGKA